MEKQYRTLTREEKRLCEPFIRELKQYEAQGVAVTLQGKVYAPEEVAATCLILERGQYMGDYIVEDGRLVELRFDRVENKLTDED
ncbi:MAG: hypothetical protein ACI4C1_06145 [Lachnospiraceae bacterium]